MIQGTPEQGVLRIAIFDTLFGLVLLLWLLDKFEADKIYSRIIVLNNVNLYIS